jgi:hypothetical protein
MLEGVDRRIVDKDDGDLVLAAQLNDAHDENSSRGAGVHHPRNRQCARSSGGLTATLGSGAIGVNHGSSFPSVKEEHETWVLIGNRRLI